MATPDPFMDELRIMSYVSRPRACKELCRVPRRNDFIEVLWCLDDIPGLPHKWCPAEVLHVYDGVNSETASKQCDERYLARGVILYLPGETWDEQVDEVEFLEGHELRCSPSRPEMHRGEIVSDVIGEPNPTSKWRFRESDSQAEEDDGEWTDTAATKNSRVKSQALIRASSKPQNARLMDVELNSLRDGHASLTIELEKVKRELVGITNQLKSVQTPRNEQGTYTSANCVLPRLRHKLALRMQTCLKQYSTILGKRKSTESDQTLKGNIINGIYRDALRVRVECTLYQFERVSRHVKVGTPPGSATFFPDYAYTQRPSEYSTDFRILFKTFAQICNIIGITSTSDQKEMVRRCGKGNRGDILRMLGTYAFDENDKTIEVSFFPGTSCGTASRTPHDCQTTGKQSSTVDECGISNQNTEADQLFPVLTRKSREWNGADNRFIYKVQMRKAKLPDLVEECEQKNAFSISWKRAAETTGKGWSFSMSDTGHVFGWLEINLPFIQVQGGQICQEFGGLATDDMWDELLQT